MLLGKRIRGRSVQGQTPNWQPLLNIAPDYVDEFMWMFEVELEDGTRLDAFKHCETRRYLHLTDDRRVFVFHYEEEEDAQYQEASLAWMLRLVLP